MNATLVSIKTRQAFREWMVAYWVIGQITDAFQAEEIERDSTYRPPSSGQRRVLIEQYYWTIDWSNRNDVARALRVFETVLHDAERSQNEDLKELVWHIQRDGYQWIEEHIVRIAELPRLADIKDTANAFDAQHMLEQVRRIDAAVEADPSLAIGTAKELVETVCKTILADRGKPVEGTPDVPTLTKATLKELKLVPEGIPDAAKGSEVIKRLLSNLATIGNGLAELRGLYGTGHGKHGKAFGLTPRHAKLAVGAATTLAVFLFETHMENGD